nr:APC family permease [Clostridia bacterium]
MQKLTKKYGLLTAIAMVVGIVIGSGIFFKAQTILEKTGGLLMPSILAWIFGGLIMVCCATAFAVMATKYEKVGGVVDYAEALVGKNYAYYVGWFISTVYLPAMTGVLAWVSARYTIIFLNSVIPALAENPINPIISHECMVITFVYIVLSYVLNTLSPKLAGKYQIATTVIKLIPLVLLGVVGVIVGLVNGNLVENFAYVPSASESVTTLFFAGIVSTAFAYEGWIIATSINAEIKDAKKNLPIALTVGTLIVMAICVLYNLGFAGAAPMDNLLSEGASLAFANLFGAKIGSVLNLFVAISCLGTLNGLMLACTRSAYSLAARKRGPKVEMFDQVDDVTNMPTNSSILGLFFAMFWFFYFYAGNLAGWFGPYGFDSSELPIITIYAMYIPVYIAFMKKDKDFGFFKRFVIPALALCGCLFTCYAAIISHKMGVVYYLIVFAAFMVAGWFADKKR